MRDDRDLGREAGPQPDPMLRSGRMSAGWIWAIAFVCVAVVAALLIAISPPLKNTADIVNGPPQATAPQSALPGGRSDNSTGTAPSGTPPAGTTGSGNTGR